LKNKIFIIFKELDLDKHGSLSREQFERTIQKLDQKPSDKEYSDYYDKIDKD
jgi:Ca2+-binding EF-hand superfamily protein